MFLAADDIQLGRGEPIKDTARVMGRMLHGAVIRTFAQRDVEDFAQFGDIPTINALTDVEHPCQILSDLFTIRESGRPLEGLRVAFIGDGDCNVARSWMWAAVRCGFELRVATPENFRPSPIDLGRPLGNVNVLADPLEAARGADVLYTDVWVSMGKEDEAAFRLRSFETIKSTTLCCRWRPARSCCTASALIAARKSPRKFSRSTQPLSSVRPRIACTRKKRYSPCVSKLFRKELGIRGHVHQNLPFTRHINVDLSARGAKAVGRGESKTSLLRSDVSLISAAL